MAGAFDRPGLLDAAGVVHMQALHFVGFKDDRYWNAVRVWGRPDFVHRFWDVRASHEIAPGDKVVFASGDEHSPLNPFAYDDSAHF